MVQKVFTIRYDNQDEKINFHWKRLKVVSGFRLVSG